MNLKVRITESGNGIPKTNQFFTQGPLDKEFCDRLWLKGKKEPFRAPLSVSDQNTTPEPGPGTDYFGLFRGSSAYKTILAMLKY